MKKKHMRILVIMLFAIVSMLVLSTKVEAATASIQCETTGEVNKPIKITVAGNGVQWNLKLLVDGQQIAKNSELENYESNKAISFSGTYTPTSTGKKTVTLVGSVTEFNDGSTVTSFTSKTITINEAVSKPQEQPKTEEPKKGSVTSCEVDGIKIKESRNVTNKDSVSVKVVTSTGEGLTIYNNKTKKSYSAKSGQTINVQIMEGTNTLTITLESGAKATRKVYSKKQEEVKPNVEEPTQSEPEQPEEPQEVIVGLQSLVIKGVTVDDTRVTLPFTPGFASDVYEYQMLLDESFSLDYTKLDVEAIALQEDFVVEVTGLEEELKDGENVITITVKSADGEKVVTYKVTVTKEAEVMPISAPVEEEPREEIKPIWNETQQIIIVVFTSVVALMGIIYAIVEYRYGKKKGKNKEESQIPYSGLDFEKEVEEEPEKKKKKSKKQQKLEAEEEAENFFGRMAAPKEKTVNSILDDNKQEKTDDTNQKDEKPNLDNIFGTNNMNQNIEDMSQQPRKRGKHF